MRKLVALLLTILGLAAAPLAAQVVVYHEVIEEEVTVPVTGSDRFVQVHPQQSAAELQLPTGIASFGPFRVLDANRAALVDATDTRSPGQFTAMLHAFPKIGVIEMIECPGTDDDRANLRLGMMIHARGIVTHVPDGGSVRSGGVELFLAGARRIADPGSEFAVHSWADEYGNEAKDYAPDAPENSIYIDYYRQMGMNEAQARAFYAMTNSVPNADAKWLTSGELAQWVNLDSPGNPVLAAATQPAATLDSMLALN